MTTNTVLDELHEMFTAAHIEHRYTSGDLVITVIRRDHVWTVGEDCIIYWGDGIDFCIDVCKYRRHDASWPADAYDYISDVYSEAQ